MENRDGAPRVLAQARGLVNLFCAVLRTSVDIYFAFKTPHSHPPEQTIQCFGGAKLESPISIKTQIRFMASKILRC